MYFVNLFCIVPYVYTDLELTLFSGRSQHVQNLMNFDVGRRNFVGKTLGNLVTHLHYLSMLTIYPPSQIYAAVNQ